MKKRLIYIYNEQRLKENRSEETDLELKIIRNIFKHTVPKAFRLLEDLLNHKLKELKSPIIADLGHIINIFENSHLPATLSAMEEIGIPIETLEKITTEKLSNASFDTLLRYLRRYSNRLKSIEEIDTR